MANETKHAAVDKDGLTFEVCPESLRVSEPSVLGPRLVSYLTHDRDSDQDDLIPYSSYGEIIQFSNRHESPADLARGLREVGCTPSGARDYERMLDEHEEVVCAAFRKQDSSYADPLVTPNSEIIEEIRDNYDQYASLLRDLWESGLIINPYAVILDVYDHGGQQWSLMGQGTQCQFDTARGAGVWLPSDERLAELEESERPIAEKRVEAAQQFLESYNKFLSGDVYSIVNDVVDAKGRLLKNHWIVGGYVGWDWAIESLDDDLETVTKEFFESSAEARKKALNTLRKDVFGAMQNRVFACDYGNQTLYDSLTDELLSDIVTCVQAYTNTTTN